MSKNLNEAAMAGNLEEVVFRLNLGEDVNQMSNKNSTALHDATTCGRVQIVKILIERWVHYITTDTYFCPLNCDNTFRNSYIEFISTMKFKILFKSNFFVKLFLRTNQHFFRQINGLRKKLLHSIHSVENREIHHQANFFVKSI